MTHQTVVSGVSRGLGAALFECLINRGRIPVGIARRFSDALWTAASKGRCTLLECDLSNPADASKLPFEHVILAGASKLVFINNAAVVEPIAMIGRLEDAGIIASFMVNVVSPAVITNRLAAVSARNAGSFKVINISSGAADHPVAGWAPYCAGKAAARMFFRCVAAESHGIEVETIDPGTLDTGMQEVIRQASKQDFPGRDRYVEFKRSGELLDPAVVARDILAAQGLI